LKNWLNFSRLAGARMKPCTLTFIASSSSVVANAAAILSMHHRWRFESAMSRGPAARSVKTR
jgi:hypothetical protein